MSSRIPSHRVGLWFVAVAALVLIGRSSAQTLAAPAIKPLAEPAATFDLAKNFEPNLVLDGPWRFQFGDDPSGNKGWASPSFDDSHWAFIRPDRSWSEQGVKDQGGSLWYRGKLLVPAGTEPLGLYLRFIWGSYQVFADGQLLATQGWLPPHPHPASWPPRVVSLPYSGNAGAHTVQLAIRVWADPTGVAAFRSGLHSGSRVGTVAAVQSRLERETLADAWNQVDVVSLAMLETLAGVAALALFAFRRTEKEYLWFGVYLLLSATERELYLSLRFHVISLTLGDAGRFLEGLDAVSAIFFYRYLLDARRSGAFWLAVVSSSLYALSYFTDRWTSIRVQDIEGALFLPYYIWVIALVLQRVRQGRPDARLLLVPALAQSLFPMLIAVVDLCLAYGWMHDSPTWFYELLHWPFPISTSDLINTLFLLAMLAILIYRFSRTRLHEEAFEREREAARTVQQVIIPAEIPPIPGFVISNVYSPFGEVGGDFFQIIPCEGPAHPGSVLFVIGDVSGKGLPAAMTVSLLVGTFRTLAHYTQSPCEILAAMNGRLIDRSNGGFTTCLILRADRDGTLVVANAGHLSPYCDGNELAVEPGLPLGLDPIPVYPASTFQLEPGAQLTLLTDGVVEARSKTGELFGFARTASISRDSAESIARTAQTFGQDDDITVLSLRYVSAPESEATERADTSWRRDHLSA